MEQEQSADNRLEDFTNPENQEKKEVFDLNSAQNQISALDTEIAKITNGIKIDSEKIEEIRSSLGLENFNITWPAQAQSIDRISKLKQEKENLTNKINSFSEKEATNTATITENNPEPGQAAENKTFGIEEDPAENKESENKFLENFINDLEKDFIDTVDIFQERISQGLDEILNIQDLNNIALLVNFIGLLKNKMEKEGRLDLQIVSDLFISINGILPNIVLKINQTPVLKDSVSNLQNIKNTINSLSAKTSLAKTGISILATEELSDDLKNSGPDPVSELKNKLPQTIQLLESLSTGLDHRIDLVNQKIN